MGFRSDLEAKEAQLERLRQQNEELRDALEAKERAAPQRERRPMGFSADSDSSDAPVQFPFDPRGYPLSRRVLAWAALLPCVAMIFVTCVLVRSFYEPIPRFWIDVLARTAVGSVGVVFFRAPFQRRVVYGVKPDGEGGWTAVAKDQRLGLFLIAVFASAFLGLAVAVMEFEG